jgi:ribosomal protein S18 acetylase RimI-like enzyme
MIVYKTCTDVSISQIFEAFSLGFSDYILPLSMEEAYFKSHFFGPEGNQLEYSYIALDENRPIGLILSGIRLFDGLKTMRCGALCVGAEYRGKGISQKLFEMHHTSAVSSCCSQLFLEVIRENHRALNFYKKLGYQESTILKYYSNTVASIPSSSKIITYKCRKLSFAMLKSFRDNLTCHINWQSDTPYYENSQTDLYLGIFEEEQPIGMLAMSPKGKINFLWVEPSHRLQGIGHFLLLQAIQLLNVEKFTATIPSNALLEGFFRKLNFQKEKVEQYEMYLPL